MAVKITWLGHSALALEIDNTRILVDPFLTNNPLAGAKADDLAADYILLTHGHGDHIGDTLSIAQRTGAPVIANYEVAAWCADQGVATTHGMNPDGPYDFGFARIGCTLAFHSSFMPDGSYGGIPVGFLIYTPGGETLYLAGDTALFSDMALIGEKGLDFAAIPIGGYFTMGPDEALRALGFLKPKVVLPIHYNTFPMLQVDVADWAQRVHTDTGTKVVVVDPGGSFTVGAGG